MFYTYIIYSESKDRVYIDHTGNLQSRLERHNSGGGKSTKTGVPWKLIYCKEYSNKSEAMKSEY
jgi:putative endonuclease